MKNKNLFFGFFIGALSTFIGTFIFTIFFSELNFFESVQLLFKQNKLGGLLSIGSLINIPIFLFLVNKRLFKKAYGLIFFLLILVLIIATLKIN